MFRFPLLSARGVLPSLGVLGKIRKHSTAQDDVVQLYGFRGCRFNGGVIIRDLDCLQKERGMSGRCSFLRSDGTSYIFRTPTNERLGRVHFTDSILGCSS